jgi:hypothetical protein
VVLFTVEPTGEMAEPDRAEQAARLLREVTALPSVRAAGLSDGYLPLEGADQTVPVQVLGSSSTPHDSTPELMAASPGLFATRSTPLLLGRDFTMDERHGGKVVIVNEAFAREWLAGAPAIGRRIRLGDIPGYESAEIIGVVKNVTMASLRKQARPAVYVHFFQMPNPRLSRAALVEVLAKDGPGGGSEAMADVRALIRRDLPGANVSVRRLSDVVSRSLINETVMAILASFFGVLALLLGAVGLYGVLAFSVACRTAEIGVRRALGATRGGILWLVMSDAVRMTAVGTVCGIAAIWPVTRLLGTMLFGLGPADPVAIGGAVLVLVGTAAVASSLPALRAANVDAMVALRNQ